MRVLGDCCRASRGLQPSDDGLRLSVHRCARRLLESLPESTLAVLATSTLDCSVLFSSKGILTSSVHVDSEEISVCLVIEMSSPFIA
jgi:hypothetical protein